MIQTNLRATVFIALKLEVNNGEVVTGKFPVRPRQNNALVFDDADEVARVIVVAKSEFTTFLRINTGCFLGESGVFLGVH